MISKTYDKSRNVYTVKFQIPEGQLPQHFEVKTAAIVADFNNWSILANPMTRVDGVGFEAIVELKPTQTCEFRYVLNDTQWYNDWAADGYVPNRLQNADNCVISLAKPTKVVKDDLTKVLGIGPKIAGLLKADGIGNFAELAAAPVDRIQGILNAAGKRYQMAVPTTWPQQASMAASGAWDKLKAFQESLDGGRPADS